MRNHTEDDTNSSANVIIGIKTGGPVTVCRINS